MPDWPRDAATSLPPPFHSLGRLPREVAVTLYLNKDGVRVGSRHFMSDRRESVDVSVRLLVSDVLALNAAGVLLAHNHPRGDHRPSGEDLRFTRRLFATLETIGVRLLDHYVVAPGGWTSFREEGLL
ncbi:DNA repair protein RadC [Sphingomonas palmae]|uniref:DNA repair protein RadC n=1 Tax=Sphingomonas palmae TaxID=1855283 RepID=A0A1H7PD83_9SPHN|nr:JAB domain-containing protein [Sphingomonas palmae]SEL33606.1 DNA repair protein RadC [Sphingomonas palmae]